MAIITIQTENPPKLGGRGGFSMLFVLIETGNVPYFYNNRSLR